jgi:hypothetical protein
MPWTVNGLFSSLPVRVSFGTADGELLGVGVVVVAELCAVLGTADGVCCTPDPAQPVKVSTVAAARMSGEWNRKTQRPQRFRKSRKRLNAESWCLSVCVLLCVAVGALQDAEMLALTVAINLVIEGTTALTVGVVETDGVAEAVPVVQPEGKAVAVFDPLAVGVAVGQVGVAVAVADGLVAVAVGEADVGKVAVGEAVGITVTVTVAVGAVPVGIGTGAAVASLGSGVAVCGVVGFAEVVEVSVRLVCPGALLDLPLFDLVRVLLADAVLVVSLLLDSVPVAVTVGKAVAVSLGEAGAVDCDGVSVWPGEALAP